MIKIKFLAIFLIPFFVACTSSPKITIKEALDSWMGKSEQELITSWGIPSRSYQLDGKKLIEYNFNSSSFVTTISDNYNYSEYNYFPPTAETYQVNNTCRITFTIQGSIIRSASWRGNSC